MQANQTPQEKPEALFLSSPGVHKNEITLTRANRVLAIVVSTLAVVPAWFLGLSEFQATVLRALGYFLATVYAASWDLAAPRLYGWGFGPAPLIFPKVRRISTATRQDGD